MMKEELSNLAKLSQTIGARLDYVQGGGGNISAKIKNDLMAIKASGYELKNVTENDGFAFVDHFEINKKISYFIQEKNGDDVNFSAAVKSSAKEIKPYKTLRPSMETGFHSLLNYKYVIHSHSVYVLTIICAREGKKIAAEIFPDALWIDYENPGWQVTQAIAKKIKSEKIIFLQNHGLIVAGEDVDEVLELHEKVNEKIKSFLNLQNFDEKIKLLEVDFIKKNVIFPDQIVFGLAPEFAETQVAKHIFAAYSYILQSIKNSGLEPIFISQKNIDFVANMESEKYRKEIAKK